MLVSTRKVRGLTSRTLKHPHPRLFYLFLFVSLFILFMVTTDVDAPGRLPCEMHSRMFFAFYDRHFEFKCFLLATKKRKKEGKERKKEKKKEKKNLPSLRKYLSHQMPKAVRTNTTLVCFAFVYQCLIKKEELVSNLVFYAQSSITVMSGR